MRGFAVANAPCRSSPGSGGPEGKDLLDAAGTAVGVNLALVGPLPACCPAYRHGLPVCFDGTGIRHHLSLRTPDAPQKRPVGSAMLLALGACHAAWRRNHPQRAPRLGRIAQRPGRWPAPDRGAPAVRCAGPDRPEGRARTERGGGLSAGARVLDGSVRRRSRAFTLLTPAGACSRPQAPWSRSSRRRRRCRLLLPSVVPAWKAGPRAHGSSVDWWRPQTHRRTGFPRPMYAGQWRRAETDAVLVFAGQSATTPAGSRRCAADDACSWHASLDAPADGSHRETVMVAIPRERPQSHLSGRPSIDTVSGAVARHIGRSFGDGGRHRLSWNRVWAGLRSFFADAASIFRLLPGNEPRVSRIREHERALRPLVRGFRSIMRVMLLGWASSRGGGDMNASSRPHRRRLGLEAASGHLCGCCRSLPLVSDPTVYACPIWARDGVKNLCALRGARTEIV